MSNLSVEQNGKTVELEFSGTPRLADVLEAGGFYVEKPCGGRGSCGKCAVKLQGRVSEMNAAEIQAHTRLACQAVLFGDAHVVLPEVRNQQIEMGGNGILQVLCPMLGRYGAAVDIGTTTIALKLYDLQTGGCIAEAGMRNPQTAVAADVMGRIGAALDGKLEALRLQVHVALKTLLGETCANARIHEKDVTAMVVTGNTTMLYFYTGRKPDSLACAPFEADCLFDEMICMEGREAYFPPCMNAFVGADITCAVLSAGQCDSDGVSLLIDIGTNGEIALWKDGVLYVTSTAAGPAFEGAGISCGCANVPGAIDRIKLENGELIVHTIEGVEAVGVCGSGLIDAIACFLETGDIDETGATDEDELPLRDGVALQPKDIRAVQLAKAAIAAGIETLMEAAGVDVSDIGKLYIAGGFGSHLNVQSAVRIGLIPAELGAKVHVLGNAALAGAAQLLLDRKKQNEIREIANCSRHVNLGGNSAFNEHYMDQMFFPEA